MGLFHSVDNSMSADGSNSGSNANACSSLEKEYKERITSLTEANQKLNSTLDACRNKASELAPTESELQTMKSKISSLKSDNDKLNDKITTLNKTIETLKRYESYKDEIVDMEKRYSELNTKFRWQVDHGCEEQSDKYKEAVDTISKLNLQLASLTSGSATNDSIIKNQRAQIEELNKRLDELTQTNINSTQRMNEEISNAAQYEADMLKSRTELREIKAKVASFHDTLRLLINPNLTIINESMRVIDATGEWLKSIYEEVKPFEGFYAKTKDMTGTDRENAYKEMFNMMRMNLRNGVVTAIENASLMEINFKKGGVTDKTMNDMTEALKAMKDAENFKMSTVDNLVKVINAYRKEAKLKETGIYNALYALDLQKEISPILEINDEEKETFEMKMNGDTVVVIMVLVVIVTLVYMNRYELIAFFTGKERFVNLFGGRERKI